MTDILDQIMHDLSGKATILSIIIELNPDENNSESIENIINFIIQTRTLTQNKKNNFEFDHTYFFDLLENIFNITKEIERKIEDIDLKTVLLSLLNLCSGYRSILSPHLCNNNNIIKLLCQEKNIKIINQDSLKDITVGLLLILKSNFTLELKFHQIIIFGINYNIFHSRNGILDFLQKKYLITHVFDSKENTLRIYYEQRKI